MNFAALKLELQKRCLDLGQTKRPDARYGEALNTALAQYPFLLWSKTIDGTTLDTATDTRDYDLSGISYLTHASQVRRVWIDDSDGVRREIGRYEVQGEDTTLTLVLDSAPTADRDITIEFWTPPISMALAADENPTDDEWLLARAMLALMGEADWETEDPQLVISQVEYWNAVASNREAQLLARRRRTSRRPRTTNWREYVR